MHRMYTVSASTLRQVISRALFPIVSLMLIGACCIIPISQAVSSFSEDFEEKVIEGDGPGKILVIPVNGVITDQDTANFFGPSEESTVASVTSQLNRARKDDSLSAVILKVNSPGGGVTASDIIYREILEFKKAKNIPVVAVFMDMAASGGYYISMAADRVYAHPTSITGSIGVIFGLVNVKEGLDKIGIKDYSITSGDNKSIGSPTREMTEQQQKILQSIVDDLYQRFVTIVKAGRPDLSREQILKLADGRVYSANQAKSNGLVDDVGYFDEFVKATTSLPNYKGPKGVEKPKIVIYTRSSRELDNIYQASTAESPDLNRIIKQLVFPGSSARFYFLWTP